jgi:hypothetical protein
MDEMIRASEARIMAWVVSRLRPLYFMCIASLVIQAIILAKLFL